MEWMEGGVHQMKIIKSLFIGLFVFSCLSGCSSDPSAYKLYKQETPLEAEIIVPEKFEPTKAESVKVILTQDGKKVEKPDYVHLEIWKQDGSVKYGMTEEHNDGNGRYSLSRNFEQEGLYYVQVHASYNDSIIMPTKQFVVGELSESDLHALQSDALNLAGSASSHH